MIEISKREVYGNHVLWFFIVDEFFCSIVMISSEMMVSWELESSCRSMRSSFSIWVLPMRTVFGSNTHPVCYSVNSSLLSASWFHLSFPVGRGCLFPRSWWRLFPDCCLLIEDSANNGCLTRING